MPPIWPPRSSWLKPPFPREPRVACARHRRNENLGDARAEAKKLSDAEIGIDVVPVHRRLARSRHRKGDDSSRRPPRQPYEVRVVVNNLTQPTTPIRFVKGKLTIVRTMGKSSDFHVEEEVTLKPGKNLHVSAEGRAIVGLYLPRDLHAAGRSGRPDRRRTTRDRVAHIRGKGRCC